MFSRVRRNYFRLYLHYMYFNIARTFYLQADNIFAFIVLRGLNTALKEQDDFTRFSVAGLVVVFGFQSVINMGVNLQLMPAKGMTLPFISYGGSSLIAIAISMGMVLALIAIWIAFHVLSDGNFLTARNLWNLSVQSTSVAIMGSLAATNGPSPQRARHW